MFAILYGSLFLMKCSTWDAEAETYIRNAIVHGRGEGNGGVPNIFPNFVLRYTNIGQRHINPCSA